MSRFSVRRFAFALIGAALFFSAPQPSGAQEVLNGIAAVVNSEVITFGEVRELVAPKEKQARDTLKGEELVEKVKEIRLAAINDLIDRSLIIQEFKSKGFTIPEYFIDERVTTIIREEFGNDRQAFLRTLAAQGFTLEKFRGFERDKVIVQEMRRQAIKGVTAVSDTDVVKFYKEHVEEYSSPEEIKLRMITIRGSTENDSGRKMIGEIRAKIVEGAEFGDLARMYSQDSNQEASGDWGWIDRKKLNESLTKVAFALKAGEVSQVIELAGSYYLMFCEAKKQATVKPLKEVRGDIEKALLQTERQKQQQEWLLKLRRKAFIKLY